MKNNLVFFCVLVWFYFVWPMAVAQEQALQVNQKQLSEQTFLIRPAIAASLQLAKSKEKNWYSSLLEQTRILENLNPAEQVLVAVMEAQWQFEQQRYDLAQVKISEAENLLKTVSKRQAATPSFYYIHHVKAQIYASQQLFKNAFDEKQQMMKKVSQHWEYEQQERLAKLERKYQVSLKEKTYELLEGEQAIQKLEMKNMQQQEKAQFRNILLFILLTVAFSLLLYRQLKVRKRLSVLTETDGLTSLYNRRSLFVMGEDNFALAAAENKALSVIMADIDHFKKLNDTYGHDVGDKVIVEVAKLGKESFRTRDMYARIGGEEYAVILPDTPLKEAHAVAERFREKVQDCIIDVDGKKVRITISIGVATMTHNTESFDGLLHLADQAMYQAKHQGRNQVVC